MELSVGRPSTILNCCALDKKGEKNENKRTTNLWKQVNLRGIDGGLGLTFRRQSFTFLAVFDCFLLV